MDSGMDSPELQGILGLRYEKIDTEAGPTADMAEKAGPTVDELERRMRAVLASYDGAEKIDTNQLKH
eukprot:9464548-Heterocapsa_arctica.AAC.1